MSDETLDRSKKNVAEAERWISVVAGSALAAYGLKIRSVGGLVISALGGALVWRGATGHCLVYEALGVTSVATIAEGGARRAEGRAESRTARSIPPLELPTALNAPPSVLKPPAQS